MTKEEIESAMTFRGGWTRAQLAEWGVPWPPPNGWKQRLIHENSNDSNRMTHHILSLGIK